MALTYFSIIIIGLAGLCWTIPFYVVPAVMRRAADWGVMDLPDVRKQHHGPVPRLGGLSLAPALWLGCSVSLLLAVKHQIPILANDLGTFSRALIGLLIGGSGMFILGCIDDFKRLTAGQKISFQAGIALVSLNFLTIPSLVMGHPMAHWALVLVFFVWLVVIPNSVNLLDGIDGLTAILGTLFLIVISGIALLRGEPGWVLVCAPFLASLAAFLKFNWNPAQIFLGDSGSLLIGFLVAYLSLALALNGSGEGQVSSWNFLTSASLVSIWLIDTVLAILRRYFVKLPHMRIFFRRSKVLYWVFMLEAVRNIFRPDRKHIHHKLLSRGLKVPEVVLIISLVALMIMTPALIVSVLEAGSFIIATLTVLTGFLIVLGLSLMTWRRKGAISNKVPSTDRIAA